MTEDVGFMCDKLFKFYEKASIKTYKISRRKYIDTADKWNTTNFFRWVKRNLRVTNCFGTSLLSAFFARQFSL